MISIPERLGIEEESEKKAFDNYDFNLRTASPGIVESFDSEKQTVTVKLAIKERIKIEGVEEDIEVPLLVDVPIVFPSAGGFSLTVPVIKGDECLVIFSDTCFDNWYESGDVQKQFSLRRHDLSDGFAIMGVNSQPKKLPSYSEDTVQLRTDDGIAYVEITKDYIVNVIAPGNVNVSTKNAIVTATEKVEITAPSGIECTGDVTMNNNLLVKGTITGESAIVGKTTGTFVDAVSIEDQDFMDHTHHHGGDAGETDGVT